VKEWTERPEGTPVYVVTRGGDFGIHRVDDRDRAFEKADAVRHALNALDAVMNNSGQTVWGNPMVTSPVGAVDLDLGGVACGPYLGEQPRLPLLARGQLRRAERVDEAAVDKAAVDKAAVEKPAVNNAA
jgi:hypothetical protein